MVMTRRQRVLFKMMEIKYNKKHTLYSSNTTLGHFTNASEAGGYIALE